MHYSFVILHYLAPDVTRRCIDTILSNFGDKDISVIAVDNASPDGSGDLLKQEYSTIDKVHFILLDSNEGFARGNNAGYDFAKETFDPDFIIVLNNDVMINDKDFLGTILQEYEETPFAVLGPDIHVPSHNWHQSPVRLEPMTIAEVKALRCKMAAKYRFHAYKYFSWNAKLLLGLRKEAARKENAPGVPHYGCVLHGACYIFSRDFIRSRNYAFNPATFLYTEEDILNFECTKTGLVMRYSPHLHVEHLEDVSTNAAFKSSYRRSRMKYKNLVDSLDVLLRLMKNE